MASRGSPDVDVHHRSSVVHLPDAAHRSQLEPSYLLAVRRVKHSGDVEPDKLIQSDISQRTSIAALSPVYGFMAFVRLIMGGREVREP